MFVQVLNLHYPAGREPSVGVTFDLKNSADDSVHLPARQEEVVSAGVRGRPRTLVYRLDLGGVAAGTYQLRATVLDRGARAGVQGSETMHIAVDGALSRRF